MGVFAGPEISESGLVLALDAGNPKSYPGSGTTWTDLSGRGNTGTLLNGVGYSSSNLGVLSLDGVDDIVSIPDSNILDITTAITLESWIYPTKSTGIQNVISKSSQGVNNSYIYPRTDDGWSNVVFYIAVPTFSTLSTPWPSRNAWHHTVATYDGATMKIYIDGALSNSKTQTGAITTNSNSLTIGSQPGYGEYYGGRISSAKIYNRALSAQEIQQNFNALRGRFGI